MINKNGKFEIDNSIALKVIELHDKGYDVDFLLIEDRVLLCLQSNMRFLINDVMVNLVKRTYDKLSNSYKHVLTIETKSGEKGVLLSDSVFN